jgi:hypothetical protein
VISARVVPEATLVLDIPRRGATADLLAADDRLALALTAAVAALLKAKR